MSRLDLAGEAFLSSVQPSMSELQPEAAVSRSEGFYSCTGPELCVIQKLSKTMAIPLGKSSFSDSVLLSITGLCRNTSSREPPDKQKKKIKKKHQKKESSWCMRVQVLVEVACGVPAFKTPKIQHGVSQVF